MNDTIYRFDGNSYGAMVLERQLGGYGFTGLNQVLATISYNLPSFLNPDKLQGDVYMRNEEAYQDVFYGLPEDVDYISDFWSILLGYSCILGLLMIAPIVGYLLARLIRGWSGRPRLFGT